MDTEKQIMILHKAMNANNGSNGYWFIRTWNVILILITGIVFNASIVLGQAAGSPSAGIQYSQTSDASSGQYMSAPVTLDGRTLFSVRGISSYPAKERAALISGRIKALALKKGFRSDSLKVIPGEDFTGILAEGDQVMNVYDGDAELEMVSRAVMAKYVRSSIAVAIDLYREERSRSYLLNSLWKSLVAVAVTALLIALLLIITARTNRMFQAKVKKRIETVESISHKLIRSEQLWKMFNLLVKTLKLVLVVLVLVLFLNYALGLFPWTRGIATFTSSLILNALRTTGRAMLDFLPHLAMLVIIFLIARYLNKLIRLLFEGIRMGGIVIRNFEVEWAMPTFKLIRLFIIIFALIFAYPHIPGSQSVAFKGITVFLGILFSMGSSSYISNIIAGYSIIFRSAFKSGNLVQVDNHMGFVEEQSLMVTRMRSIKNEEIVLPNSTLLNRNIVNYSKPAIERGVIIHTSVGIGYETPWRQVDAMLKLAAERTPGLHKTPPPYVLKKSLGDFAIVYEINAYCTDVTNIMAHYSRLHENILDVFNENQVQIMTPAYERDPAEPKVVPPDKWDTPLAGKK